MALPAHHTGLGFRVGPWDVNQGCFDLPDGFHTFRRGHCTAGDRSGVPPGLGGESALWRAIEPRRALLTGRVVWLADRDWGLAWGQDEGVYQHRVFSTQIGCGHEDIGRHVIAGSCGELLGWMPFCEAGDFTAEYTGVSTIFMYMDGHSRARFAHASLHQNALAIGIEGVEHGGHIDQSLKPAGRALAIDLGHVQLGAIARLRARKSRFGCIAAQQGCCEAEHQEYCVMEESAAFHAVGFLRLWVKERFTVQSAGPLRYNQRISRGVA